jgi:hypothetical protein
VDCRLDFELQVLLLLDTSSVRIVGWSLCFVVLFRCSGALLLR